MNKTIQWPLLACSFFLITACETTPDTIAVAQEPEVKTTKPAPVIPRALTDLSKEDILLAQNTLKELGFPVGSVDGIWGKQSAAALRLFEEEQRIPSLNGQLSDISFAALKKLISL